MKQKSNFEAHFPIGKKGMEMWLLVLMIIAAVFLVFMLVWYTDLGKSITELIQKIGELL